MHYRLFLFTCSLLVASIVRIWSVMQEEAKVRDCHVEFVDFLKSVGFFNIILFFVW